MADAGSQVDGTRIADRGTQDADHGSTGRIAADFRCGTRILGISDRRVWVGRQPEQFKWLLGYSPYHRVEAGTRYPAVLLTSVEGEAEVPSWHARKMTAALQAVSGPGSAEQPVLLRVDPVPQDPAALFDLELRDSSISACS